MTSWELFIPSPRPHCVLFFSLLSANAFVNMCKDSPETKGSMGFKLDEKFAPSRTLSPALTSKVFFLEDCESLLGGRKRGLIGVRPIDEVNSNLVFCCHVPVAHQIQPLNLYFRSKCFAVRNLRRRRGIQAGKCKYERIHHRSAKKAFCRVVR